MYEKNNYKLGYFVARDKWTTVVAKIIEIKGVTEGKKIPGIKPYYNGQEVIAMFYQVDPETENIYEKCNEKTFLNIRPILCPGNFSYYQL